MGGGPAPDIDFKVIRFAGKFDLMRAIVAGAGRPVFFRNSEPVRSEQVDAQEKTRAGSRENTRLRSIRRQMRKLFATFAC